MNRRGLSAAGTVDDRGVAESDAWGAGSVQEFETTANETQARNVVPQRDPVEQFGSRWIVENDEVLKSVLLGPDY
jgi:hypothetical protein